MPSFHVRVRRPLMPVVLTAILVAGTFTLRAQSVNVLLVRGDSLLDVGKPQKALDVFDQAVKKESTTNTLLSRARAFEALNRMDRFLLDVDKALKLDSSSGEAHFQRARYALRATDTPKAEYHVTKAIELLKSERARARALNIRGEVRAEDRRNVDAIADFERAIEYGVEEVQPMRTLARLYDGEQRHADALRVLERLCDLEPSELGHWSNRGYELTMLERYDDALKALERALMYDKDEPVALSNRAYTYVRMGRNDEAWADVERSIKNFPSNAHALRTRAILRLRKGEREKACQDLSIARALADIPEVDQLWLEQCGGVKPKR
ncbi:MAG: tetratricopeptide repeat protein [Flavobacteriales bacterium]|nr:tetratricopeptide repeat protein [Flavobacteriales bacterium]